jgi:hypothetical protein
MGPPTTACCTAELREDRTQHWDFLFYREFPWLTYIAYGVKKACMGYYVHKLWRDLFEMMPRRTTFAAPTNKSSSDKRIKTAA